MHTAADVQMTRLEGATFITGYHNERIVRTPFCLCVRLSLYASVSATGWCVQDNTPLSYASAQAIWPEGTQK